jgi:hypothetical protein
VRQETDAEPVFGTAQIGGTIPDILTQSHDIPPS